MKTSLAPVSWLLTKECASAVHVDAAPQVIKGIRAFVAKALLTPHHLFHYSQTIIRHSLSIHSSYQRDPRIHGKESHEYLWFGRCHMPLPFKAFTTLPFNTLRHPLSTHSDAPFQYTQTLVSPEPISPPHGDAASTRARHPQLPCCEPHQRSDGKLAPSRHTHRVTHTDRGSRGRARLDPALQHPRFRDVVDTYFLFVEIPITFICFCRRWRESSAATPWTGRSSRSTSTRATGGSSCRPTVAPRPRIVC